MKRLSLTMIVLAAACGGAQWREADDRLNRAVAGARAEGFAPLAGPYNNYGTFELAFTQSWTITLDSGVSYLVGAACSDGCEGLDAAIRGHGGEIVARDTTDTPVPLVRLTPPASGTYTVDLVGKCAAGTRCRWVVQVYGRGVTGLRPGFAGGER